MGRHNAFARRLVVAKEVVSYNAKQAIVRRCINTLFYASAIALNEEFGLGAKRLMRFKERMEKVVEEYGLLASGADTDYADDKLEEAFKKIMER